MFDFLFKRKKTTAVAPVGTTGTTGKTGKTGNTSNPSKTSTTTLPTAPAPPTAASLREQALQQAAAVAGDEAAAVQFILHSSVAEARLLAAQAIHDRTHMEQVYKATRETDRRVARLMQQRLAAGALQDQAAQRAQAVLAQAASLAGTPALRANQVVAVARDWQAITAPPAALAEAFAAVHARLEQRLQAQAALQRQVLDRIARLQGVIADADATASTATIADAAQSADGALAAVLQDAELASLPRHLLPELSRLHDQLQQVRKAQDAAAACIAARETVLDGWEQQLALAARPSGMLGGIAEVTEQPDLLDMAETSVALVTPTAELSGSPLPAAEPAPALLPTVAALQQAWRALPAIVDAQQRDALQQRFDSLLARLKPAPAAVPVTAAKTRAHPKPVAGAGEAAQGLPTSDSSGTVDGDSDGEQVRERAGQQPNDQPTRQRAAALQALQAALEEGALQRSMEQDRLLRALDAEGGRLTASQQASLNAARAELGRLQGWARWGGTVSREELLAAVEALPAQQLAPGELARKVGSMRGRWRALDTSAGAAPRALWLRFDTACTIAHAPVAAHLAMLSQERAANAHKAQAIIDEVTAFVRDAEVATGTAQAGIPDWRAASAFSQRMRSAWQRLGPLERQQQKQLDAAFSEALQPLAMQLAKRQQEELAIREVLIDEVAELAPQARDTPERLQAVQARWQQAAKAFPLTHQVEQACWQRFRAACDAVFTDRKTAGAAADAQRNTGLLQKQELCAVLERCLHDVEMSVAGRARLLRDTRALWLAAGPVPRAAQPALQARFDAAMQAIEASRHADLQALAQRQAEAASARLALCIEGEALLLAGDPGSVDALATRWQRLPALDDELGAALRRRFDAVLAAAVSGDPAHVLHLKQNQVPRDAALLRLEVDLGLESPPAFQRERLALQVASLQSTFRSSGMEREQSARNGAAQLCALPASADATAAARMNRIVDALYAAG